MTTIITLGTVAGLLILGATTLALGWVTVADRRHRADLDDPTDELTRIADVVTDETGRAL